MTGGKPSKPKPPADPAPPPQAETAPTDTTGSSEAKKRKRGYLSTILASGMNKRNDTSILNTGSDKLG